jgi:hypothetical protein
MSAPDVFICATSHALKTAIYFSERETSFSVSAVEGKNGASRFLRPKNHHE